MMKLFRDIMGNCYQINDVVSVEFHGNDIEGIGQVFVVRLDYDEHEVEVDADTAMQIENNYEPVLVPAGGETYTVFVVGGELKAALVLAWEVGGEYPKPITTLGKSLPIPFGLTDRNAEKVSMIGHPNSMTMQEFLEQEVEREAAQSGGANPPGDTDQGSTWDTDNLADPTSDLSGALD